MEKKMEKSLKISVDSSQLDRLAIGARVYDAFNWQGNIINFNCILKSDKETKDILIKESDLMKLIQLVNVGQPDRSIRIINDDNSDMTAGNNSTYNITIDSKEVKDLNKVILETKNKKPRQFY